MSLIVKRSVDIQPIAAGTYIGVCYAAIDLGLQYSKTFDKTSPKVMLMFELGNTAIEIDGEIKRRVLSKSYTAVLSDKSNLSKDLKSWIGDINTADGFDLSTVLGRTALLSVSTEPRKDGKGDVNRIGAVMGCPAQVGVLKPENPIIAYNVEDGQNDVFNALPEWIRNTIINGGKVSETPAANTGKVVSFAPAAQAPSSQTAQAAPLSAIAQDPMRAVLNAASAAASVKAHPVNTPINQQSAPAQDADDSGDFDITPDNVPF